MSRHLVSMQLGLYFFIGNATPDKGDDVAFDIFSKAYPLIARDVSSVPGWHAILDNNGFPSTQGMGSPYPRAELCELDYESKEVDGKVAFSLWFHADGKFPLDLVPNLRDFCLQKIQEAAGATPVAFAKARTYSKWEETETKDLELQ